MFSGDIAASLQLVDLSVSPVAALTPIGSDPPSTPSQRVAAFVEQELSGGLFNVAVGGRTLQLALPPQTAVGQTVQLLHTANGGWALEVPANTAASWTEMSQTGRLVDLLLQAAPKPGATPANPEPLLATAPAVESGPVPMLPGTLAATLATVATVESGPVPTLPGTLAATLATTPAVESGPVPTLPGTLAAALASALGSSGMFYESHLQQWIAGARSLASMAGEPQAQLNASGKGLAKPDSSAMLAAGAAANEPAATASPAAAMSAGILQAGVHPDAVPIIAQQLTTLETGHLTWRGELWPGQSLHWEIVRDDDADDASGSRGRGNVPGGGSPRWRTRLAISFPHLGAVTADLTLQGNALSVRLNSAEPSTKQRLGAAAPALGAALAGAGLDLKTVEFENEPATQG